MSRHRSADPNKPKGICYATRADAWISSGAKLWRTKSDAPPPVTRLPVSGEVIPETPKRFYAKSFGKCARCDRPIIPGSPIWWLPLPGCRVHDACK